MSDLAAQVAEAQPRSCPLCHSTGPFEVVDELTSRVCSCGHIFQEDASNLLTLAADFNTIPGWGDARRWQDLADHAYGTATNNAILALRAKGAAGSSDETRKADREIYHRTRVAELHAHLRMVLRRLTGIEASRHCFEMRIRGAFDILRAALLEDDEQGQDVNLPRQIPRLTWGKEAKAAMAACVYAVFRQDDAFLDVADAHCFSLQLVASCSDAKFRKAQRWLRILLKTFPQRFEDVKVDEPILHVDQAISWLRSQTQVLHNTASRLRLPGRLCKLIRPLSTAQWKEARLLARTLCATLLVEGSKLSRQVTETHIRASSSGEWGYYMVLWAVGAIIGRRLQGKDWIKRDLIRASLGMTYETSGKHEDSDEEHQGDDSEATYAAEDHWRHVRLYQSIGTEIATRAAQLPWIPPEAVKNVKGGRIALKEGLEVQYLGDVVDFAGELKGKSTATEMDLTDAPTSEQERSMQMASVDARNTAPLLSYTAVHFPALSQDPTLLDTLDADTVDTLLFGPDEMTSYLRTDPLEREALLVHKHASGEWTRPASGDDGRPSDDRKRKAKGEKHEEEGATLRSRRGRVVLVTQQSREQEEQDQGASTRLTGPVLSNIGSRRTKADSRLQAAARGVVLTWTSDGEANVERPSEDDDWAA